jgi:superfamily II DNA or RNA helicase
VTSYECLLSDLTLIRAIKWNILVLDEGHRLKNPNGKTYAVLRDEFNTTRKILLTGTPIQNNLEELFAILALLNPTFFSNKKSFEQSFSDFFSPRNQNSITKRKALNESASEILMRRILSPILLLRTLKDVNDTFCLPPLSEIVIHTPMSSMQKNYYKEIVSRNREVLNKSLQNSSSASRIDLLNILPQLRKACNHPYLFPGAEPEPFCEGSHLYENSGKLHVLHQILPRLKADGHCVLLFSQSTSFLDIIQDYLTYEGFSYERVDGSVRGKERWQAIERFRDASNGFFVFLISTRSGGVGLNLQRADTVIFADSDYNPQADLQAIARAYRLGQTKPIHVIKLVCAHSVEEVIYYRAMKKIQMANKVRNCARRENDLTVEAEDDDARIMDLIQFGLHKIMEEKENSDATLKYMDEKHIKHILKRKGQGREINLPEEDNLENQIRLVGGDFHSENIYYFDGKDYSKSNDRRCLEMLCSSEEVLKKKRLMTRNNQYGGNDSDDLCDLEETVEEKQERICRQKLRKEQIHKKKLETWKKSNYTSMVIEYNSTESTDADINYQEFFSSNKIRYCSGDASCPQVPFSLSSFPRIVIHCVDTSGAWCNRGFFRSVSGLSPNIQKQYESAALNQDLKLGQAHLIPIEDHNECENFDLYVCLLVVQGYKSRNAKKQKIAAGKIVRNGTSTMFRLTALEKSLQAVATKAKEINATIHMPRIGYGTPSFNWYAVERIIKRQLHDRGVSVSIYYYVPNRRLL